MAIKNRIVDPGRQVIEYFDKVFKIDAALDFDDFYLVPNMKEAINNEKTATLIFSASKLTGKLVFKATDCPLFVQWLFSNKEPVFITSETLKQLRKVKKSSFNNMTVASHIEESKFIINTKDESFTLSKNNCSLNMNNFNVNNNISYKLKIDLDSSYFSASVFSLYAANSQLYVYNNTNFIENGSTSSLLSNSVEILCTSISSINVLLKNPNAKYIVESTNNIPMKNTDIFNDVQISAIGERLTLIQHFKTLAVIED